MIETEQAFTIDAARTDVWDYVQDIRRWAELFPGYRECTIVDESNSQWQLKVGAGGLMRTVNVLVHIDRWAGPERVDFTYKLAGDPVEGSGSYVATATGPRTTDVELKIRVVGTGPMAPMWEAVSKPLLPQLAKSFAGKLKSEIEARSGAPAEGKPDASPASSIFSQLGAWLRSTWRAVFAGRKS